MTIQSEPVLTEIGVARDRDPDFAAAAREPGEERLPDEEVEEAATALLDRIGGRLREIAGERVREVLDEQPTYSPPDSARWVVLGLALGLGGALLSSAVVAGLLIVALHRSR